MRSFLGDAALFDDDDFIRVAYRAQTVGDDDGCAPFEQCVEGLLYEFFALGVEGGCRLVEDEDFGVFENGAGDAEALTLPAGEFRAAVADVRLQAVGSLCDELFGVGDACRIHDLFARGFGVAQADVILDGVVKEYGILRHDAHPLAQGVQVVLSDVAAVDADFACRHVVKARNEV